MGKFTEAKLEEAFIEVLDNEGYPHKLGNTIERDEEEVLIENDLRAFLKDRYNKEKITDVEIDSIVMQLKTLNAYDLYETNKTIMSMISDGFELIREDRSQKIFGSI